MCFYRRSEIPRSLLPQADKHHWGEESDDSEEEEEEEDEEELEERGEQGSRSTSTLEKGRRRKRRLWLKEREVFLSRQVESLPATLIRGKCSVTLLSEVETLESYGSREDAFFYALVYDPVHKTLLADRGEIRIGSAYQATVPAVMDPKDDTRDESLLEQRLWDTEAPLPEEQIDKFLIISRSVGTFARALDCSSSVKQPSLHMSAAAASRDVTLFQAHHLLHKYGYDIGAALGALVPKSGPMLCRDEMEDWSASEANLFEEAVEKYGKDFNDIRRDFLPWKSMKNIVEFFFMWKTTDRYVQQKRLKAIEAESKLKQVYVPPYNNKSTRLSGSNGEIFIRGKEAEAYTNLSKYSWVKYKKYGSFVSAATVEDSFILDKSTFSSSTAAKLAQLRPGLIIEPGSPAGGGNKPGSGKTRAAFYLRTTPLTRASRRICRSLINMTHFARKSGTPIDMKGVKADAMSKMSGMSEKKIRNYNKFTTKQRVDMSVVVGRLGQKDTERQEWLVLTPRSQLPRPARESFPRPSKRSDGSYIYDRIPSSYQSTPNHNAILYKKRAYEDRGAEGPATKVLRSDGRQHVPNVVPPKGRVATLTRIQGGQKQVISWMDAPDDVFYKATHSTKKLRKKMPVVQLRRAARKPFKKVISFPA
eukprot:TRINITY_DN1340_c0_g1_i1.p1 TRINITY_DN1340_c0_g1~~TRINITY_DN1340_c0_g1_i1.p1  ORF type:complete len:757 (-),score=227.03 TRINITY_DN1340_c0_g1_i1:1076-3013(-)